jgi:hypothetical protein
MKPIIKKQPIVLLFLLSFLINNSASAQQQSLLNCGTINPQAVGKKHCRWATAV